MSVPRPTTLSLQKQSAWNAQKYINICNLKKLLGNRTKNCHPRQPLLINGYFAEQPSPKMRIFEKSPFPPDKM